MTRGTAVGRFPKDLAQTWDRLVSGEAATGAARVARALLRAGGGVYGAGALANRAFYDRGWIHPSRADQFVLGVGNLTLGGTGKTTTGRFIAGELLRRGLRPAIVLRGYRRAGRETVQLVSNGDRILATLEEAGDEALMLARALRGVAVAVGKKRERVCSELLEALADVVILDDAFQYWRLEKDYEVVLLDATRPQDLERLFPAGALREPLRALRRADAVWLTRVDQAEPDALTRLRKIARDAVGSQVVETRHRPTGLAALLSGEQLPLDALRRRRVGALSSVGNPGSFERALRDLQAESVIPIRFPDHHAYSADEVSEALAGAGEAGAEMVVTTEKDAVRLPAVKGMEAVHVLKVELEIVGGGEAVEGMLAAAERGRAGRPPIAPTEAREGGRRDPGATAAKRRTRSRGASETPAPRGQGALARPGKSRARKAVEVRLSRGALVVVRAVLGALPRERAFRLGERLGDVMYTLFRHRRRIMLRNMEMAFGSERTPEEIAALGRACMRHLGRSLAEFLLLPAQPDGWLDQVYDIVGRENLDAALARGKGVLLAGGHLGNWELGGVRLASAGYPVTVIAREMDDPRLETWVHDIRSRFGLAVVGRDDTRKVLRCLRRNEPVGILADLNTSPGPNAVTVRFLGQEALSPNGTARLAVKTGAPIVPALFYRKTDGRHVAELRPMILADPDAADSQAEVLRLTQAITDHLEAAIRRHPEQWMWLNDRWRGLRRAQQAAEGMPEP